MSVNILVFEGHLGKDPELKKDTGGNPFCTFTMAQTMKKKVKGEEMEYPLWAEVTIFGRIAESHAKNLHKGRRVLVNGSMTIEDWTDRQGKPRYTFKIKASEVNYIDEPSRRGGETATEESTANDIYDRHEEEKPLTPADGINTAPWGK